MAVSELESLRIKLLGDASNYLGSLKEAESATRTTATRMEGATTQATQAVAQSQQQVAKSYAATGQAAAQSSKAQVAAVEKTAQAAKSAASSVAQPFADLGKSFSSFGSFMTDAMKLGQQAAPFLAIAYGAGKAAQFISEMVNDTVAFRDELRAMGRASDEAAAALGRLTQARLGDLRRSDAPLADRQAKLNEQIKAAKEARDKARQIADAASDAPDMTKRIRSTGPLGPLGGWLDEKVLSPNDYKRLKQKAEDTKKMLGAAEAEVKALEDAQQQLSESLKDAVFGQQSASKEAIALARVPEFLRGAEKLKRAGASDADVKATKELATEEMTTRFAAETEKATQMLQLQAKNAGATSAELSVLQMELEGVTGKQLELAKAAAQANKVAELNLSVIRLNESLKDQLATFGMAGTEAEIFKLKLKGATEAQLAQAKAMGMQLKGKEVTEQFKSAQEKAAERIEELNELLKAGAIDQKTYGRAVADANKQLQTQRQELSAIQGAAMGGAEALERFNKFQDAIALRSNPAGGGVMPAGGMDPMKAVEQNAPKGAGGGKSDEFLREIRDTLWRMEKRGGIDLRIGGA